MKRKMFDDEHAGSRDEGMPGRSKEKPEELHIDFTPMIDCVVLLLGYFMVTTNLDDAKTVDVPPAKHGAAASNETSTILTVRAGDASDRAPELFLGNGKNRRGDLGDGDDGAKHYVEEGLRRGVKHVIVKADRDVAFGFVQDVTRVVASVEGVTFSIAVQDKKDRAAE